LAVLVLDDLEAQVDPDEEPFEVVRPGDLAIDTAELHRMAVIYDVMELATALKPWLLETLVRTGSSVVLYLDPDIQVFSSLEPLAVLAGEHGIALTPHTIVPLPRDQKTCDEDTILASGIYNLGFIGVSEAAMPFLSFWQERLRRECIVDPKRMRFVDQRWVDFVPGLYDHVIVREPEYNVAYWNLHSRQLTRDGSDYHVNGRPLAFFHFSGYSPQAPHLLSKHQGSRPRILFSEHPELAGICDEYAALLVQHGYGADDHAAYGFARAANGVDLDTAMRNAYRDLVERADELGGPEPPDPFDPDGAIALLELLNRPSSVEGWSGLTAYLEATWSSREDLQQVYPDPRSADHEGLLAWARNEVAEGRMEASLATAPRPSGPTAAEGSTATGTNTTEWAPSNRLRPGMVVAGYLSAEVGVGEGGRLTSRLVESAGIPFTTVTYTSTPSRREHPFRHVGEQARDFDTNIIAVNADRLPEFAHDMGRDFLFGRYNIGQWAWELEEFPRRFWPAFDLVDEVWALSEFNRAAIAAATDKPVHVVPLPVEEPHVDPSITRSRLGLPDRFTFLFSFDLFSILERKNPLGLIRAFRKAFRPDEGPVLVLKVINGDKRVADLERIRWEARGRDDIIVFDRYLRHDEQASLVSLADCYVSLHRSEGLGLTMAESMVLGKPVIATGYSGNLDFMTGDTAHLVPWEPGWVPAGCDPYPPGSRWAEPDIGEAAALMQKVAADPAGAAALGARARETILRERGPERGAAFVRGRFEEIEATRAREIQQNLLRDGSAVPPSTGQPTPQKPPRGVVSTLVTRAIGRYLGRNDRTVEFHPDPSSSADQAQNQIDRLELTLEDESSRVEYLGERVRELNERLTTETKALQLHHQRLQRTLAGEGAGAPSWEVVQQSVAGLRAVPYMSDEGLKVKDDNGEDVIGFSSPTGTGSSGYAGFEDLFRGPEEVVRELLRPYLSELSTCSSVVDFGCGRGEMLDLLTEVGTEVIGVDTDESMIERCEAKGHKVLCEDGLAYLAGLEAESIGAVFSAQVIEHLDVGQLLELLDQSVRVLEPGGLFIAETVNPHALHGFKTFWVDLTHRVPIFPEVLVAHCRNAGFAEARIVFPGGQADFEEDRWSVGQYAVVARTGRPVPD
jgi:glycosyltransferase involved in cell wall biosynthesis/2-polyprenyl-3-methyl-5-hydroxy-6-metoxy-1,4-benzoquinol methylase